MSQTITIQPVTRIEGHARIVIELNEQGNATSGRVQVSSLRGFEKFVEGRPAEEIPRIVTRICGVCPWMHHLAAAKAIDGCFGVTPPPAGIALRELCLMLAHIADKILHFFFLAAPDLLPEAEDTYSVRNIMGIIKTDPDLAKDVVRMRQLGHNMLERISGKSIHPVAAVPGGFSKALSLEDHALLQDQAAELLDFSLRALQRAYRDIFSTYGKGEQAETIPGSIQTGFLGTVDKQGSLQLYEGHLRLLRENGEYCDFSPSDYTQYLAEHSEPWSRAKMVYAKHWQEGFSTDYNDPKGIYRVNTLARLNVCEQINTPLAQEQLLIYRKQAGKQAQDLMYYHWARLIELVYCCERTLEIVQDKTILSPQVRVKVKPQAGHAVGSLEAPRGTLLHEYSTDDNGCIVKANLIVGTTHNIAPLNMSVHKAATELIRDGRWDESLLNKVETAVRAYDP